MSIQRLVIFSAIFLALLSARQLDAVDSEVSGVFKGNDQPASIPYCALPQTMSGPSMRAVRWPMILKSLAFFSGGVSAALAVLRHRRLMNLYLTTHRSADEEFRQLAALNFRDRPSNGRPAAVINISRAAAPACRKGFQLLAMLSLPPVPRSEPGEGFACTNLILVESASSSSAKIIARDVRMPVSAHLHYRLSY